MARPNLHITSLLLFSLALTTVISGREACSNPTSLRIACFQEDVTVPIGHRLMGILPVRAERVADPLEARGFVLLGAGPPVVLVAVDWCEIRNDAYDRWREVLGEAAGTTPDRVLVTSVHQHDAPVADLGAQQLLDSVDLPGQLCDPAFYEDAVQRVANSVRKCLPTARRVTHVGVGQAIVQEVASNRRVVLDDGQVEFSRGSNSGSDLRMRQAPEGMVDPCLRTIGFWDGDKPLLALHAFATHPMSYYGRGEVSADFVGLGRRLRQQDDPGIFQIYVTGCAGDVTAGKYNDGSPENRPLLASRLHAAMQDAWQHIRRWPVESVKFRSVEMSLKFRDDDPFTASALQRTMINEKLDERTRIFAAMGLTSRQRVAAGHKLFLPCLDFGQALFVLLPGEAFVGYQLMAQRMRPDLSVVCAGYGDCWTGYIPTRAAFADGFTDQWMWVAPGAEVQLKSALAKVLRLPRSQSTRDSSASPSGNVSSDVFSASAAHPRYSEGSILPLADGSLLFAVTQFDASASDFAPGRIIARGSNDGGRTWDTPRVLQDNVGRMNVMSATLRRFHSQGRPAIGLFYLVKHGTNDLKVFLRVSTDEARSFGEPRLVTDGPGYHVMNNDRVTELRDGRLLCPVAWTNDVDRENHFVSFCCWSDDGGQVWTTGANRIDLPRRGAMEPEVIELNDGRILMIIRTQLGEIYASYSIDRGESWGPAVPWGVASPESPATLRRIPTTGDLVLVWNPVFEAAAGHGGRRTPLVATVSTDEGRTWGPQRVLEDGTNQQYAYTSLTFFEGRALLSYYVAKDATGMISTRFRSLSLDWFYEAASEGP